MNRLIVPIPVLLPIAAALTGVEPVAAHQTAR